MRSRVWFLALAAASLACNTLLPPRTPTPGVPTKAAPTAGAPTLEPTTTVPVPRLPTSTAPASATVAPSATLAANSAGVRACDYVPGVSVAAEMPAEVLAGATPTPLPPPALPANTTVGAGINTRHLQVFHDLVRTIQQDYVYTGTVENVLPGLRQKYEALVAGGLTDDDFYLAMDDLIAALGDDHSYFESPTQAAETDAQFTGNNDYVGIGVYVQAIPEAGRAVIIVVFPSGPAAEAGLRTHDAILAVEGQPVLDTDGSIRDIIRGPAGSSVSMTIQRPGEAAREVTFERRRITGALPIDFCLAPGTHVGYLFLPGLDDDTIPDQVRAALRAMSVDAPLTGLVIDNRQNGGGLASVLEPILGLFTHGNLGDFVSRAEARPLEIQPEDLDGSQTLPLVVLVGPDTVSYGEVLSGLLQATGRATVMGQTTLGNVETQWPYTFDDDSRVWLAHELFQPVGQPIGIWENTGIVPDVAIPTRWDLFTEATDPALGRAVELLAAP